MGTCESCGLIVDGVVPHRCRAPELREAFRGVELTAPDERLLRWLAACPDEADALVWLVDKLRSALLVTP